MRLTLQDMRDSRLPQVLGVSPTSDQFTSFINEGIERLIQRGSWEGTYQRVNLCVTDGCLTFPRQIAAISDVNLCNYPVRAVNQWYEFLQDGDGTMFANGCNSGCPGQKFIDRGNYPTLADISGANKKIRIYPRSDTDVGKRVLILGYDENNNWIRSIDGSTWIDGFYLTIAAPFVDSDFDIKSITGVIKEETNETVLLYELSTSGVERLLGSYEPSETVASYRRYFISSFGSHGTGCGCSSCTSKSITGIAKLAYIPVSHANDFLYISHRPAIKEICMSIRFGEMDTVQAERQSLLHEQKAVKELQHQQQNLNPNSTTPVSMKVFGSAGLWKKNIGGLQ